MKYQQKVEKMVLVISIGAIVKTNSSSVLYTYIGSYAEVTVK